MKDLFIVMVYELDIVQSEYFMALSCVTSPQNSPLSDHDLCQLVTHDSAIKLSICEVFTL